MTPKPEKTEEANLLEATLSYRTPLIVCTCGWLNRVHTQDCPAFGKPQSMPLTDRYDLLVRAVAALLEEVRLQCADATCSPCKRRQAAIDLGRKALEAVR